MDIFARNDKKSRRMILLGIILLLITLGLGTYAYLQNKKISENPVAFDNVEKNKDQYVHAEFEWISPHFAYTGEQEDDPETAYLYGKTKDGKFLAFITNNQEYKDVMNLPNTGGKLEQPLVKEGTILAMEDDIAGFAKDFFDNYMVRNNNFAEGAPELKYYLSNGLSNDAVNFSILGSILTLLFGLVFFIIGLVGKNRSKSTLAQFKQAFPSVSNFDIIDRDAQVVIPSQQIKIYDPFVFADRAPLDMIDLREVRWVYLFERTQNHVTTVYIQFHQFNRKSPSFKVKGNINRANEELMPLWQYIADNYPEIRLGYTAENIEQDRIDRKK